MKEHHHLIEVKGTYTDKKYLAMLLHPVADENLKEYMARTSLREPQGRALFRTYFGCLAQTIAYLHAANILHKDIKPENVLLKNGHLILTDFGTAYDWSDSGQSMTRSSMNDLRTPRYMSPEVARCSGFHRSSDIWSLGVVFLEMISILRGKSLDDMNCYLKSHGTKNNQIHNNLEGALSWSQTLSHCEYELLTDNEPLSWIKEMLTFEAASRPSATDIADTITGFDDGMFCGSCCKENCSDYSSNEDSDTSWDKLPKIQEVQQQTLADSAPILTNFPALHIQYPLAGISPVSRAEENSQIALSKSTAFVNCQISTQSNQRSVKGTKNEGTDEILEKTAVKKSSTLPVPTLSHNATVKNLPSNSKKNTFPSRESFVQWLAAVPAKFKASRPQTTKRSITKAPPPKDKLEILAGNQRIAHYLYTLPDGPAGYEDAKSDAGLNCLSSLGNGATKRSATWANPLWRNLTNSKSQDDLRSSSHLLLEGSDEDYFLDVNMSKHVRCPSESNLPAPSSISMKELEEVVNELRTYTVKARIAIDDQQEFSLDPAFSNVENFSCPFKKEEGADPTQLTSCEAQGGNMSNDSQHGVGGPGVEHLGRRLAQITAQGIDAAEDQNKSVDPVPRRLHDFLPPESRPKRQNLETPSMARQRILRNEASQAGTSMMSANTRAKVSGNSWFLRWTDRGCEILESFVAEGNSTAVHKLLDVGCNPGTVKNPRLAPILYAIRGATHKHLKCLQTLVSYNVDVNAARKGRTPLHYAIEQEPWSEYSSVIMTLLAAKADPNAKDPINDVPLLTLLMGEGRLTDPKEEALLLLLAPQFKTEIQVTVPNTLDTPLHLAVRHKEPYVVGAIIEKMSEADTLVQGIMHQYNAKGLTPILLAFSSFTFSDDSAVEFDIIELLLEHGACPNDQDKNDGDTPLHLVVRTRKSAVALEILCQNAADSGIRNKAGKRPLDFVEAPKGDEIEVLFDEFARLRMSCSEDAISVRPPDLIEWLKEEHEELTELKIESRVS